MDQIKETTEDDLDCPYSCRFGFQSDEKILYVTEENFNYLPDENETQIEYSFNKENYTLHLELKKVFPEPAVCKIQIKDTVTNLTKSRESLHACGSDLKIKCTIGKQEHDIKFPNDLKCTALDEINSTISNILIAGIVLGILVTVAICILAYFTYWKKRKSERTDQGEFTK
ncbi:unnamed protein product [Mytilus edulis]|uniref:Uncharacterized protein n=1 Tax=Mytilus edulis TaxID=6550 RepID=A0A8S3T3K7_MYTED|nr:unnamed protein product [Mytilus edulis]